jgi:outer membrane protein
MKNFCGLLIAVVLLLNGAGVARAQKFGWVDSEFIMAKMPEYGKAQQELALLSDTWQKEIEAQQKDLDKLHRN